MRYAIRVMLFSIINLPFSALDHKKRLDKLALNLVQWKICPTDLPN